jgi:hypothetical protein
MNIKRRIAIERKIYSRIVRDALDAGFNVSVYDGEEYALKHSTRYAEIMRAGFSTDGDVLLIYRDENDYIVGDAGRVGFVSLIYGNCGWDVISDYTYTDEMENLLAGASKLANKLEGACYA